MLNWLNNSIRQLNSLSIICPKTTSDLYKHADNNENQGYFVAGRNGISPNIS